MDGEKRWQLRVDGKETNAVTLAVVRSLLERGEIGPATPVREDGTSFWTELALVPVLRALLSDPSSPDSDSPKPKAKARGLTDRVGRAVGAMLGPDEVSEPATLDDVLKELRAIRNWGENIHWRLGCLFAFLVVAFFVLFGGIIKPR